MRIQTLNGFWQVHQANSADWLSAQVPGGVYTDLMAAGKIPDPFIGTNEETVQWVAEKNWEYRRFFYPLPDLFRQEKIWLVCDGLDTLAQVRLNGKILGQANNMYRSWRWEIKSLLREGENRLEILFRSPVAAARTRERVRRTNSMSMGIRGGPHLRKSPSHFGWDWGPRLPGMGIWREIRLEGRTRGQLGDTRFEQEHAPGRVNLHARVQCDLWEPGDARYSVRLSITGPERQVWQLDAPARSESALTVTITNPQLWWPNGYGPQPLYYAEVELLDGEDTVLDQRSYTLGLRTIELRQEAGAAAEAGAAEAGASSEAGAAAWPGAETEAGPAAAAQAPAEQNAETKASPNLADSERAIPETGAAENRTAGSFAAEAAAPADVVENAPASAAAGQPATIAGAALEPGSAGERSFTFVVNGQPVFCKGSNWIPADAFPARVTPEKLEMLVRAAAETHQNMLRVWGGGYYEDNAFYELCDRYGILVWQDFEFACATYPLDDPAYLDNVRCEVVENVRRLRHHACLALWCGNNEIEWLGDTLGWFKKTAVREAYRRFFFDDLPGILAVEDPGRPYWPGSPSSNDPFHEPGSPHSGDAHLWEVYHSFRQPEFYRQQNPRFISEFGFQALPAEATVAEFCPGEAPQFNSRVMDCHQRAIAGNPKLIWYLAQRFRLPRTFSGLVYLTQVFQAEAVRTGVEHWRRHPERTSGALYWQLNDCWPVTSWASIDYYGRWKALHYAAKRFFAPVLLSVEDATHKSQRRMDVWVSNDTHETWEGRLHWTLETLEGEVIEGGDQPARCAPHTAACQIRLDFAYQNGKIDWRRVIFTAELWQGAECCAARVVPFAPEKHMAVPDPELNAEIQPDGERFAIRVTAKRLARFVELSFDQADGRFSDNYFDLPAGRSAVATCDLPAGWDLEQARAGLRVRSLAQIGPCDSPAASARKANLALLATGGDLLWRGLLLPLLRR